MSWPVKWLRDTYANVAAYVGPAGSFVLDTTYQRMYVQDGTTAGGWAVGREQRTAVADAAYNILATDRIVAYTSISAARIAQLPAASAYPVGAELTIVDESGSVTTAHSIAVTPNGSDTINGLNSAANSTIVLSRGSITLQSNGVNGWSIISGIGLNGPAQFLFAKSVATASFSATGAQIAGGSVETFLDQTGAFAASQTITLPTVAATVTALRAAGIVPFIGMTWKLTIQNESGNTFTLAADAGPTWTLSGTLQTIVNATQRSWLVTLTSLTAGTMVSLGEITLTAAP